MLTAFLDAITSLPHRPFLVGGYILFCCSFTVRVFQSWHRHKFSVRQWDFHDKTIVFLACLFSVLTFCLPTFFLCIELYVRSKRQKVIEKFRGATSVRVPENTDRWQHPSGDVRGLCPWAIVPVGELEQHGFYVEPPSDPRMMGTVAGTVPVR